MRNVFKLTMLLAFAVCAFGQQNCDITHSCSTLYFYSGTDLAYACSSPVSVAPTAVSVAGSTLTNIVVSSNVGTVTVASAHNLWIGAVVAVSGSATAALNDTYTVATVPSSTTYTIATAGVSNATYTTGLIITTNSPTLDSQNWRITAYKYASSLLSAVTLGGGQLSFNYHAKCSDRLLY